MMRFVRFLIVAGLSTCLLIAGFAASMHSHHPVDSQHAELVTCACQTPHQDHSSSDQIPGHEDPSGECLLCRLVAEFHADFAPTVDIEFDSMVSYCTVSKTVPGFRQNYLPFQGRAPPPV